jgi:eukaryotic-like serine/threonine-protein kinase
MNKTLIVAAVSLVSLVIITATLMTKIFETTLTPVALAQANSTTPARTNSSASTLNTTPTNAAENNFLTYENSTLGIKMQYPSSWTKQTAGHGATFVLLSNGEKNSEQFMAKLNATSITGFPPNVPLKALADRVVDGYKHFLRNFKIESYANTTVVGNNGIKIVYTYTDSKNNGFKATDIALIKDDRLYVIQYYVEASKYQIYLPILQKMIDSFEMIK